MVSRFSLCVVVVAMLCAVAAGFVGADTDKPASTAEDLQPPERKQTTLGLYVTAAEAYEMWEATPDEVKVVDVRTP